MTGKRWISLLMALVIFVSSIPHQPSIAEELSAQGLDITSIEIDENGNYIITGQQELDADPVSPAELADMPVNSVLDETMNVAVPESVEFDHGTWQYELDEEGYAVITSCIAPQATVLQVPSSLDGHLVRGIGPRVFENSPELRTLEIPSSIMNIAPSMLGSLRTKVTIRAYNGTPAMTFANRYAVSAVSLSALYFTEQTIDYTGARKDAYHLIDSSTVRFSTLEGSQLKVGSIFYLPDSRKAYRVTSIAHQDGAIVVSTAEPDVQEVLTRVVADFSQLRVDYDAIELGEGITMVSCTEKAGFEMNVVCPTLYVDWDSLKDPKPGDININVKGAIEATVGVSGELDIDIFELELNKFKLVLNYTFEVSVTITAKTKLIDIPLVKIPFASVLVANVTADLHFKLEAAASLQFAFTTSREVGYEYNKKKKSFDRINVSKTTQGISFNGKVTAKICPAVSVNVPILDNIAELSVGVGMSVSESKTFVENENFAGAETRSNCKDLSASLVCDATAEFDIKALLDLELTIAEFTLPLSKQHMESDPSTIIAKWKKVDECTYDSDNYLSLFLDRNNGSPIQETRIPKNTCLNQLPESGVRPGYIADGWYLEEEFENRFTRETMLTEDTTIYYRWVENGHKLHVVDSVMGNKSKTLSAGVKLSSFLSDDSVALQYIFHGWYYDQEFTQPVDLLGDVMPFSELTVYAKWEFKADHNPFTGAHLVRQLRFSLNKDLRSYSVVGFTPGIRIAEIPAVHNSRPVTAIADGAFKGCNTLRFLNLGDNITSIGKNAFQGCSSLNYAGFNAKLLSIGELAFQGCFALDDVKLPGNLNTIGEDAFKDCTQLKSITIPSSVQSIGAGSFYGCTSLTTAVLPDHFKTIPNGLFRDCSALTSVNIPSSTVTIDQNAFKNCSALASIQLPASLQRLNADSFYGCSSLKSIVIPDSVTSCGAAFPYCSSLISAVIPDAWTSIPANLFFGCSSLTDVTIPPALVSIGGGAFGSCSSLAAVTLPETIKTIGNAAFANCSSLTSLNLPDSITSLGSQALAYSGLSSFTLPATLTAVPEQVCMGMPALTKVNLHSRVTSIKANAFLNCTALTQITLPSSVTSILEGAFSGSGLTSFAFPTGISQMGKAIFKNCTSLSSVTIPDTIVALPDSLFFNCTALKSIDLPVGMTTLNGSVFSGSGLESIVLPDAISVIPNYAFEYCESLRSITLPACLQTIAFRAFNSCTSLSSVFVPYNTTTLADWCFGFCPNLRSIYLPPTVTSIGQHSFYTSYFGDQVISFNCQSDSYAASFAEKYSLPWFPYTYEVPQNVLTAKNMVTTDGYAYTIDSEGAHIISYSGDATGTLTIPSTLGGAPVVSIGAGAMTGSFTSVILPTSLTALDPTAFEHAANVTRFSMSGTSSAFQIVNYVVYDRKNPVSLVCFPRGWSGSFSVPSGVSIIADNAFSGATKLTAVTLSSGITEIGNHAFADCAALSSIKLNSGLTSIGDMAFYNCTALSKLDIPDSVTQISNTAVTNCNMGIYGAVGDCPAKEFAKAVMLPYNMYDLSYYFEGRLLGTVSAEAGQLLAQAPSPEDDYNTFTGWYKDANFRKIWDFTTEVMPESALSLYGGWTSDFACSISQGEATITGYVGSMGVLVVPQSIGGVPVTAIAANAFVSKDENPLLCVTIPACVETIEEGALSGVDEIIGDRGAASESYALAHGITFTPNTYTLTFECGAATPAAAVTLAAGDPLTMPEPILDNHVLAGWFSSEDYLEPYSETQMPAGDLTLYALWVRCDGAALNNQLLYTYTEDGVEITGCEGEAFELIIPDVINGMPVVSIGNSAFYGNIGISKVVLPESITHIGDYAFASSAVSELTLGSNITTIGNYAFFNCAQLNAFVLPEGITSIPQGMLSGCSNIRSLSIGNQVTAIGDYAFSGMSRLRTLTLGAAVASIGDEALSGCSCLTEVRLPASIASIGHAAFSGCTALSVLEIGSGCTDYIAQDNVLFTQDGTRLIVYAANRTGSAYSVPENVTAIDAYAFAHAQNLQTVVLPASLVMLGKGAFASCEKLRTCTFDPECKLDTLPEYAFSGCIHLSKLIVPSGLLSINAYALQDAAELTLLDLPADMLSIDSKAFTGCPSLMLRAASGSYVEDFASINSIDFSALDNAVPVRQILLPLAVRTNSGIPVRLNVSVLPEEADNPVLAWSSSNPDVASVSETGTVYARSPGTAIITAAATDGSGIRASCTIIVPEKTNALILPTHLKVIAEEAFAGLPIQYIDLTATECTSIGERAFAGCAMLQLVMIPDSVSVISPDAFDGCTQLTIMCTPESAASAYADENGIKWITLEE